MPNGNSKEIDLSKVQDIVAEFPRDPGSLIPILQEVQDEYGYVPKPVLAEIAHCTGVSASEVYGVATFFAHFRLKPIGKHLIKVCHGTACHVAGAERISSALHMELGVGEGEVTGDGRFTAERVACLGCCSLAPCLMIGDDTHAKLNASKIKNVLGQYE